MDRATLREINQMEREMCNYLDWELTVNNPILGNFSVLKRSRSCFGSPIAKSMHTGHVGAAPPDQYPTQNLSYLGFSRQTFGAARCRTRARRHVGPEIPPDRPPTQNHLYFERVCRHFGPPAVERVHAIHVGADSLVFFWPWLWLFGSALASENLEPGQGRTVGFGLALAWPGSSHGFWQGFQRGFGFGLAKSQARPKPHRAKARKAKAEP
ncbi:hypothetical protein B0H14DRAFT_3141962 [Mycena olivaceomarginata]|nr:hypothetical protein B0H14DRAFT_3141962 [Mycena olivaceomarginata]